MLNVASALAKSNGHFDVQVPHLTGSIVVQDARENAMGWIVGAKLFAGQSLFSDVSWIDLGDPGRTIPMIPLQAERCFDAGYFKATHLWGTVVSGCYSNCNRVKLSDVGIWSIRVHIPTVSPTDW